MRHTLFILLLAVAITVHSQESDTTYWKIGGITTATFSQVFLEDWAAGGDNSVSINGYFNAFADYEKAKISWANNLEMGYGLIRQGKEGPLRKTDDLIIFTTQFGYKISEKTSWTSLLDFRTQFYEGVNEEGDRISDFMAPGYILIATGLDWKPVSYFSMTYAPVTGKITIVTDEELAADGGFGVDPGLRDPVTGAIIQNGKTSRAELGSFLRMRFAKDNLLPNVNFSSKLELFTNYLVDFGNIDVNWQNQLSMKVNSFLTVNWQTQLIYDDDIKIDQFDDAGNLTGSGPRVQFRSVFGVGIAYKFGATKE
jgi:hypothetical protein